MARNVQEITQGTALAGDFASRFPKGVDGRIPFRVTTAQVLALFTTPISLLVPLPGAGKIIVPHTLYLHKPAGTAYGGIGAGEELSVGYIGGAEVFQVASAGFLDQATAQQRIAFPHAVGTGAMQVVPSVNVGLEIKLLLGNITTGTSDLLGEVYYKVVDQVPSLLSI